MLIPIDVGASYIAPPARITKVDPWHMGVRVNLSDGVTLPVLKICFGPPTAESKNLKNHVNFDVGDLFFRSPALWSSQNVFGPPTAGRVVVDFKDRDEGIGCDQTFILSHTAVLLSKAGRTSS